MEIVTTQARHADLLADYYLRNQYRFAQWHPLVGDDHHGIKAWKARLRERELDYNDGRAVHFIGLDAGKVIGACSLTSITYSPAYHCQLGYSIDSDYEGRGVMTRIVQHVVQYAFDNLKMNRVCANYMPANERSARLLEKLGFEKEGYAKKYLCINGKWEDHVLTSRINPAGTETN